MTNEISELAQRLSILRLIRAPRIGASSFHRLTEEHGSVETVLEILPALAKSKGLEDYKLPETDEICQEYEESMSIGATLLTYQDEHYPKRLKDLAAPPPAIWAMGRMEWLERPIIGIVGSRDASFLGTKFAFEIAEDLSRQGITIASGLARGIDTAAHEGALEYGTIGVIATGLDIAYPKENRQLQEELARRGLLITEMPLGFRPQARSFPQRNKIIAGLSQALLVVEGTEHSGSMITARNALEYGREVFAVPGHPLDARAKGPNKLIREGAILVESAQDITDFLKLETTRDAHHTDLKLKTEPLDDGAESALETKILQQLSSSPIAESYLYAQLENSPAQIATALSKLEIDNKIERSAGGKIAIFHRST